MTQKILKVQKLSLLKKRKTIKPKRQINQIQ